MSESVNILEPARKKIALPEPNIDMGGRNMVYENPKMKVDLYTTPPHTTHHTHTTHTPLQKVIMILLHGYTKNVSSTKVHDRETSQVNVLFSEWKQTKKYSPPDKRIEELIKDCMIYCDSSETAPSG